MRTNLWFGVIFSTSFLAACGGGGGDADGPVGTDAPPTADAPPGTPDSRVDADPLAPDAAPEFACLGQPIPTTAPASLTVSGDMQALGIGGSTPIVGATVTSYIVGNATPVGTDVTGAGGAYSITISNPGSGPVDGYLVAPSPNNKTVYLFPPTLIYEDLPTAPLRTIPNSLYAAFLGLAGGSVAVGHGVVALVVADCLNNPLAGATVSSPGNTQIRYNGANGLPSSTATETAADGIAYILDVATGPVTVDAMYMGMDFREHAINAHAADEAGENAINTTVVHP
jgi:hypothetical protein